MSGQDSGTLDELVGLHRIASQDHSPGGLGAGGSGISLPSDMALAPPLGNHGTAASTLSDDGGLADLIDLAGAGPTANRDELSIKLSNAKGGDSGGDSGGDGIQSTLDLAELEDLEALAFGMALLGWDFLGCCCCCLFVFACVC